MLVTSPMDEILLEGYKLYIDPDLATLIGLNKSVLLLEIYRQQQKGEVIDGFKWVRKTYDDWHKVFPFWSITTIRRSMCRLEQDGYILSRQFGKYDKTKSYRINEKAITK